MKKVAIIYASHDGQTKKICQTIRQQLSDVDVNAACLQVEDCDAQTIAQFDVLIFGAAIRYGKHLPPMVRYLQRHLQLLNGKQTAFFSVNLTARKANRNTPETSNYIKKMLAKLDWQPDELDVFAGKLSYPQYRFFDKHMIRFIMWLTKGETDLNTVKEYTDWDRVSAFSTRLAALVMRG